MSLPSHAMLRRSSPPSRPRPAGCGLRPALTATAVRRLITSGGNGPKGKTHNTTRSANRENQVSTKPGAVQAVNNIAIQALAAAYAGRKAIVDQASARIAVTEVTSD
jgi:hypothetical protein